MSLEDDLHGFITVNSTSDEDAEMVTASDFEERGPMIIHAEEPSNIEIIEEDDEHVVARPPSKPANDSDDESVEEVDQVHFIPSLPAHYLIIL